MDLELHVNPNGSVTIVYTEPYDDAETFTDLIEPDEALDLAERIIAAIGSDTTTEKETS